MFLNNDVWNTAIDSDSDLTIHKLTPRFNVSDDIMTEFAQAREEMEINLMGTYDLTPANKITIGSPRR